ncbi:MAG: hypothetical protein ACLRWF_02905 [Ruthenibacterium sp.]
MKKLVLSAVCLALSAVLAGCDFTVSLGGNAEELLRAPQPTQLQSAVQKALVSHLGETPQMKYPRGGEELSPLSCETWTATAQTRPLPFYGRKKRAECLHGRAGAGRGFMGSGVRIRGAFHRGQPGADGEPA